MTLKETIGLAIGAFKRNSPLILTGVGVAGAISATVLAVRATYRNAEEIELVLVHCREEGYNPLQTAGLVIKNVWPAYVPAAGTLVATVAAIIGSQSINARRQAVLISMVTMGERALAEFTDKVIEVGGEKLERQVRDAIAVDHVEANPPSSNELIIPLGKQLCYDDWGGRYFHGTKQQIEQARNDLNKAMLDGDMYASLNDFYMLLELSPVAGGETVGWSAENMVDVNFTSKLLTEEGQEGVPCLVFGFRVKPLQDYYKLH